MIMRFIMERLGTGITNRRTYREFRIARNLATLDYAPSLAMSYPSYSIFIIGLVGGSLAK